MRHALDLLTRIARVGPLPGSIALAVFLAMPAGGAEPPDLPASEAPAFLPVSVPCPDPIIGRGIPWDACLLSEEERLGGGTVIYRMYTHPDERERGMILEFAYADRPDSPFLSFSALGEEAVYYHRPVYEVNQGSGVEFIHVSGYESTGGKAIYPFDDVWLREARGPWLEVRQEYEEELERFLTRLLGRDISFIFSRNMNFRSFIFNPNMDFRTLKGSGSITTDSSLVIVDFQLRLVRGADGPALMLKGTPRFWAGPPAGPPFEQLPNDGS